MHMQTFWQLFMTIYVQKLLYTLTVGVFVKKKQQQNNNNAPTTNKLNEAYQ